MMVPAHVYLETADSMACLPLRRGHDLRLGYEA